MRTGITLLSLLLCLAAVQATPAQTEVLIDPLEVQSGDVRYFVALGTEILEFTPGWNDACQTGQPDPYPYSCCTGEGTGTCVVEADPEVELDSWVPVSISPPPVNPIADVAYMPDGNIYFSIPASHAVGRVHPDGGTADYIYCEDSIADTCEPTDLGVNYYGDLLAVDGNSGGLLAWTLEIGLCSDENATYFCRDSPPTNEIELACKTGPLDSPPANPYPYSCCTGLETGTCDVGHLIPGSTDLGSDLIANQEWYTGQMMVVREEIAGGGKGPNKPEPVAAQLVKVDNPEYLTDFTAAHSKPFPLEGAPTDLTVSQAQAFYTDGKKLWSLDLGSGVSSEVESFGNEKAQFLTGDVGEVVYVGTVNNQAYRVRRVWWDPDDSMWKEIELKRFRKNDWDRVPFGGVTTTYSTLLAEATPYEVPPGSGLIEPATYLLEPDGMHKYRFTAECPAGICPIAVTPVPLLEALNAIENSEDFNDPNGNDRLGLPLQLAGQSHPWRYLTDEFVGLEDPDLPSSDCTGVGTPYFCCTKPGEGCDLEFQQFSTAISGTNFRLACCPTPPTPDFPIPCEDPTGYCAPAGCDWAVLESALPISSDIVPDPRTSKRGTGSACYESLTSTKNPFEQVYFCGWNSPAVEMPDPLPEDEDYLNEFFCGSNGVYSISYGSTFPVKFNVAVDEACTIDPGVDLNILFSAGVVGTCEETTFTPLREVRSILGIEPNGEGDIDPRTDQVKFAKAGPKKQYQFNFNSGQVPPESPPGSVRTIVMINATFLEDNVLDGDQSIFIAVDGVPVSD